MQGAAALKRARKAEPPHPQGPMGGPMGGPIGGPMGGPMGGGLTRKDSRDKCLHSSLAHQEDVS